MANRFPLVIDTTDGNKIKELPSGDNLNLRESSIVNVQDVTALGTINAADITVNGERLVAQNFADLSDTPSSFVGAADYFVKVKEDGTGLEFRPFSDIGNIEVEQIEVSDILLPTQAGTVDIGSDSLYFRTVVADEFKGDLISSDDERVFEAATGKISYAALQGAPTSLSEFVDDIGFLRTIDLDDSLSSLFDEGVPFETDIKGSVFGDDSTLLIDGVNSVVTGDIDNFNITTGQVTSQNLYSGTLTVQAIFGPPIGDMQIDAGDSGIINIGTGASTTAVNIENAVIETFDQGSGLGIAQISTSTDLSISAGNRVKIDGAVPFRLSSVSSAERGGIAPQSGDIIYNSSDDFVEFYQGNEWISLHQGTFTGNVTIATGESNFNNVVIAGNLTVSGTTTTVDTANTTIKDNVIVLNEGEVGTGVTAGTSGIEIDRGSETNKTLVWDETDDKWTVGSETFAANTFEAVGFQGAFFGNGGLNSPLQLSSGLEGQTGNTIFINPQGSDTLVQMWGETVNLVTGPFNTYDSPYMQFKTEGAFKAYQGAYFVGDLTGNITGDVVGSVFGDDSTTIVDAVGNNLNANKLTVETVESTAGLILLGQVGVNITSQDSAFFRAQSEMRLQSYTGNITLSAQNNLIVESDIQAGTNNILAGTFIGNVTGDVEGNVTGNVTGDVIGSVFGDDSTMLVDAVNNKFIGTLIGDIVGDMTGDPTLTLSTPGDTSGEIINLIPGGDNNFVNIVADNIRFFGNVTNEVSFTGGIIGDVKGTITGDDSTILVDAVNSVIPYGVLEGAPTALSDFSNDLDYAGIVGNTIALNGLPVDTFMTGDLDAQGNDVENANLVNATGNLRGDVIGSVFSDDSSKMVDAVDFAMFSDTLTLTPLNAEPNNVTDGIIAIADGTSWDPLATGVQTMMVYLDSAWRQIATA